MAVLNKAKERGVNKTQETEHFLSLKFSLYGVKKEKQPDSTTIYTNVIKW